MRVTDRLIQDAKKREKRRRAPGDEAEEKIGRAHV